MSTPHRAWSRRPVYPKAFRPRSAQSPVSGYGFHAAECFLFFIGNSNTPSSCKGLDSCHASRGRSHARIGTGGRALRLGGSDDISAHGCVLRPIDIRERLSGSERSRPLGRRRRRARASPLSDSLRKGTPCRSGTDKRSGHRRARSRVGCDIHERRPLGLEGNRGHNEAVL